MKTENITIHTVIVNYDYPSRDRIADTKSVLALWFTSTGNKMWVAVEGMTLRQHWHRPHYGNLGFQAWLILPNLADDDNRRN